MSRNNRKGERETVKVELKYCEHCGGLWVREGGAGVYCERCQPKVAELPIPKKKPGQIKLPEGRQTVLEEYGPEMRDDGSELDAAGGAA